jgi:formate hydrogenlyase subunit 4
MNLNWENLLALGLSLLLAPALTGIVNRVKAYFAGRCGQPLLQPYYDILKLLRKGSVYSHSVSWPFHAAPLVGLGATLCAATMMPFGPTFAPVSFAGDMLLFAYLLALGRFFTVLAALDTASSFEGMGASRELQYAALAEPAMILGLATLAILGRNLSLSGAFGALGLDGWIECQTPLIMLSGALFIVTLAECSRVPFDDPNTHLELTMVHEAMILDNSGPDLGMITYTACLKLWLLCSLVVMTLLPLRTGVFSNGLLCFLCAMALAGCLIGVIESVMARFRFIKAPQTLVGASALALLAMLISIWSR